MITATLIFLGTYIIIGIQRIPRIHIDRPSGALLGAVGMVAFGVLSLGQAYSAIDLDTLCFLLGMMILIAYLELSGFFEVVERWVIGLARSTRFLLLLVVVSSAVLSALFMNDTICLMYTPVILRVTKRLRLNPVPYLIALATSANIGSTATIMGNPQNALIGLRSGIPFLRFSARLWPIAAVGVVICFLLIWWIYRREISSTPLLVPPRRQPAEVSPWLLAVALASAVVMFVFLALDFHPPGVTMTIASVLILAGSRKPRRALEKVDWTLLFLFAGLFVVMRGVEEAGLVRTLLGDFVIPANLWSSLGFSGSVVLLSNLVSNVPAVLLYAPIIGRQAHPESIWLLLAMASTLAGNLTIIGSVANLIVFEAAKDETEVSFFEYLKVGLPLTLITVILGTLWLVLS